MEKRLAVILDINIKSEHYNTECEHHNASIDLHAPTLGRSINDLKKPLSASINKNLLQHIDDDKDREYTVVIKCRVGEVSGEVAAKIDLDDFNRKKLYAVLQSVSGFSDNLAEKLCNKVRCLVMDTTGFHTLYID